MDGHGQLVKKICQEYAFLKAASCFRGIQQQQVGKKAILKEILEHWTAIRLSNLLHFSQGVEKDIYKKL